MPALTDHLGYWVRQLSNHVSHAFSRKVATRGVTVAEWSLMRMLYGAEPAAPSDVARRMGMTRGSITKLADRLVAKELVARQDNPADARSHTLRLTPAGQALVPQLAALADENERECFGHLTAQEQALLRRLVTATVTRLGISEVPVD